MRYLLDTNIVIFWAEDRKRLTAEVEDIIEDYNNQIYVSSESIEEIILLIYGGRITVKRWKTLEDVIDFVVGEMNFEIKSPKEEHLRTFANLPRFKDHKDPFDWMIISQAMTENITLVSSDTKFPRYRKYGLDLVFNDR